VVVVVVGCVVVVVVVGGGGGVVVAGWLQRSSLQHVTATLRVCTCRRPTNGKPNAVPSHS